MPPLLSRRAALVLALSGAAGVCIGTSRAAPFVNRTGLRPGSFVWQPNLAPSGPLLVVVALREQTVHVYRAGIAIGISTCASGARDLRAPTGLFRVAGQHRDGIARSGERLVWTGAALHAARIAGDPARRGCVQLPNDFADLLFAASADGLAVAIAEERSLIRHIEHPCGLFDDVGGGAPRHCAPPRPGQDPVSLVVSGAEARAYVMRGARVIETVAIGRRQAAAIRGTRVYALASRDASRSSALSWLAFAMAETRAAPSLARFEPEAPLRGLSLADRGAALRIAESLQPGSTILLTEPSAGPSSRADAGIAILANSVPPRRPAPAHVALRRTTPAKSAAAGERLTSATPLHDLFRPY